MKKTAIGTTLNERLAAGKALRDKVPRGAHAKWAAATREAGRQDPVELIKATDRGRIPELLPIRYQRMRESPFRPLEQNCRFLASQHTI